MKQTDSTILNEFSLATLNVTLPTNLNEINYDNIEVIIKK